MNFGLPDDAAFQIASSTGQLISAYSAPAEMIIGILLALYILERIIDSFHTTPMQSDNSS